jgi:hypothetical protein
VSGGGGSLRRRVVIDIALGILNLSLPKLSLATRAVLVAVSLPARGAFAIYVPARVRSERIRRPSGGPECRRYQPGSSARHSWRRPPCCDAAVDDPAVRIDLRQADGLERVLRGLIVVDMRRCHAGRLREQREKAERQERVPERAYSTMTLASASSTPTPRVRSTRPHSAASGCGRITAINFRPGQTRRNVATGRFVRAKLSRVAGHR